MKKFILAFACLLSLNLLASTDSMVSLLQHRDIIQLEEEMSKDLFKLSKVEDVYNIRGVRPRCPCNSYKLTFTKHSGLSTKKNKVVNVQVDGFASNLRVTIKK